MYVLHVKKDSFFFQKFVNICNVCNVRFFTFICFFIVFYLFHNSAFADNIAGCGEDANPGIKAICDIIMFLQGRIARSLVAFSVMLAAWGFVGGQFKWQEMLTLAIGIGIFYAPKTFALFLLPEYIQGIVGDGYDITTKYTPDEIITCACPNLR